MENNIKPVCPILLSAEKTQKIFGWGEKKVSGMFAEIREEYPKLCSKTGKQIRSFLIAQYLVGGIEEDETTQYDIEKMLKEMGEKHELIYGEK